MNSAQSRDVERLVGLYQLLLLGFVILAWLIIGVPSLWALRVQIGRLLEHFTWIGLKFLLFYKPELPSLGVLFCIALTLYMLISMSRYELFGLFESEKQLIQAQVDWIRQQGSSHILYRWVIGCPEAEDQAKLPPPQSHP